jgi:hypothetical protein
VKSRFETSRLAPLAANKLTSEFQTHSSGDPAALAVAFASRLHWQGRGVNADLSCTVLPASASKTGRALCSNARNCPVVPRSKSAFFLERDADFAALPVISMPFKLGLI